MENEELDKLITNIFQKNGLGKVHFFEKQNIGFNRMVLNVNDSYCLKICINPKKENGVINEINYYKANPNHFNPILLTYDTTKEIIPYVYTIEEKIKGTNLFEIWEDLDDSNRKKSLLELIQILKIIHKTCDVQNECLTSLISKFDLYLDKIKNENILSSEKIEYLHILKTILPFYFQDAAFGYIHGDVHFNNLIYTASGLRLIDFECYGIGPIDKDFDSINRMTRNPNSLIKKGLQNSVNSEDYNDIMPFLIENYPEVCQNPNFNNRLLIYDCINSLKWLSSYPEHEPYHDILFNKSKKLLK